jgi:hypothetical protein
MYHVVLISGFRRASLAFQAPAEPNRRRLRIFHPKPSATSVTSIGTTEDLQSCRRRMVVDTSTMVSKLHTHSKFSEVLEDTKGNANHRTKKISPKMNSARKLKLLTIDCLRRHGTREGHCDQRHFIRGLLSIINSKRPVMQNVCSQSRTEGDWDSEHLHALKTPNGAQ